MAMAYGLDGPQSLGDLHSSLLEEARHERSSICLVSLMLQTVDDEKRMVTHNADHGDGDGHERVAALQSAMQPFLRSGERLYVEEHEVQY